MAPEFLLNEILWRCELIESESAKLPREAFYRESFLMHGLLHNLEIIGEAVAKLSDEIKDGHPHVPWFKIRGLRNRIAHVYWDINYDEIYEICTVSIPELRKDVAAILGR